MTKDEAIAWAIIQLEPELEYWTWGTPSLADTAKQAMEALTDRKFKVVIVNHEGLEPRIYVISH